MNKKVVVVIGCDGYIGHALVLRLLRLGYEVVGIDDLQRRNHVKEMGSFSATDIETPTERHDAFQDIGDFEYLQMSIDMDYELLESFLKGRDIHAIVNLAQQPSAPFSFKSLDHAATTTTNNLIGTLHVLYFMKRHAPNAHLVQIGSMGEYDHSCGIDIAEGTFDFDFEGRTAKNAIFPRRPGSWYHASKVASTYYIDAACRWWGLRATDIMQGVVYGNWTKDIENTGLHTRLDSDECFGTVVNRFIVQSVLGEDLTVYGDGEQERGYLALSDAIQCLMLAVKNVPKKGEYRTWNQIDTTHTINEIAHMVSYVAHNDFDMKVGICHIPSPRVEKTDKFDHYNVYANKLAELGFTPQRRIIHEARFGIEMLLPVKDELFPLRKVVLPKIGWK
jgi:UDP-sulfoquinovose synthase